MPEPFALDDPPMGGDVFGPDTGTDATSDKVVCPECNGLFKPSGLNRHITMAHRDGVGPTSKAATGGKAKKVDDLANRWAQFQRGAALMVAFACNQCATVLVNDAMDDGIAIAEFCSHKPKLKKQVDAFLSASDAMILVGALGNTAKKMIEHHSIGQKLGLNGVNPNHTDQAGHGMESMAQFMQSLSEEDRNALLNDAFQSMAQVQKEPAPAPTPVVEENWSPSGVGV